MHHAENLLINGIVALAFSLGVWKMTGSFWGWAVLAVPGALLIFAGWIAVLRE
jgi:hypothetical protein